MQRLTNSDNPLGLPWLEVSQGDGARQQILLDTFPFVIGRNQDTDLPVTSGGVLREHASIEQDGRGYRLARQIIDERIDYAQAASRLHTRVDVRWNPWESA